MHVLSQSTFIKVTVPVLEMGIERLIGNFCERSELRLKIKSNHFLVHWLLSPFLALNGSNYSQFLCRKAKRETEREQTKSCLIGTTLYKPRSHSPRSLLLELAGLLLQLYSS